MIKKLNNVVNWKLKSEVIDKLNYTNHEDILPGICLDILTSYFWVPLFPSDDSILKWLAWPVKLFSLQPNLTNPSLSLATEWSILDANFSSCTLKVTYK